MKEKDRKKFAMNSFVFMPIGLVLGLFIAVILIKLMGFKIEMGKLLLVILFVILIYASSIFRYYKKLLKNEEKAENYNLSIEKNLKE